MRADGDQPEPSVLVFLDLAEERGAADVVQIGDAIDAGLAAMPDGNDAEFAGFRLLKQVPDKLAVAVLKDIEREHQAGKEHSP